MTTTIGGSRVLITGGTGSFGRRVAAALSRFGPAEVRILSRDEKKQYEMSFQFPGFTYILGDVRDAGSVRSAMRGIDIVFHAAALKQVPSCERWPMEAVKTNVLGSANVFGAAARAGVKTVVALSTDKAVKPVNAMGMTKALMEKCVQQAVADSSTTTFCCVRYGNVLGSRGSVLPLFRSWIAAGAPLLITDPAMTRFLLTLDDAVELVFFAMESARPGDVLVRKAPACRVDLLAEAAIRHYGRGREVSRKITGARVGEKMHEVLVSETEMSRSRDAGDYFVIPADGSGPGPAQESGLPGDEYTSANTTQITDVDRLVELLQAAEGNLEAAI